jgi:hypothetical protein
MPTNCDSAPTTEQRFRRVLDEVAAQVLEGKGEERHGRGLELGEQPWVWISKLVGPGFCLGQVLKKLLEAEHLNPAAARRERLGVIAYIVFRVLLAEEEAVP